MDRPFLNDSHDKLLLVFSSIKRQINEYKEGLRECIVQRNLTKPDHPGNLTLAAYIDGLTTKIKTTVKRYDAAFTDYATTFGPIVSRYNSADCTEQERKNLTTQYYFLARDRDYFNIENIRDLAAGTAPAVNSGAAPAAPPVCENCEQNLVVEEGTGALRCPGCGFVCENPVRRRQRSPQSGNKRKEHFFTWSQRIQGREKWSVELEAVYPQIEAEAGRQGLLDPAKLAGAADVRMLLQSMGLTKYNPNIISIRARLLRLNLAQISRDEEERFYDIYERVTAACHNLSNDHGREFKYYPHTYSKIIQAKYGRGGGIYREIVENIHVQSERTTAKNDSILSQAFDQLGLTFYYT
jgi:predicted RNA-binding Zn-ribbon protein involved in translation (DUF1610 family)